MCVSSFGAGFALALPRGLCITRIERFTAGALRVTVIGGRCGAALVLHVLGTLITMPSWPTAGTRETTISSTSTAATRSRCLCEGQEFWTDFVLRVTRERLAAHRSRAAAHRFSGWLELLASCFPFEVSCRRLQGHTERLDALGKTTHTGHCIGRTTWRCCRTLRPAKTVGHRLSWARGRVVSLLPNETVAGMTAPRLCAFEA